VRVPAREPSRALFDEPGPRARVRIRLFTVLGLLLVAALLALAATVYVMTQQTGGNLEITGWIVLGSVLYFALYLRSRRTGRWTLDDAPAESEQSEQ